MTYNLRWRHNSPYSYTDTATSYDYFDVTITYECDADTLALSTQIGQWIYIMDASPSTKDYMPTQGVSGCAWTMACEKWRESDYTWVAVSDPPFNACDKTNGIIVEYDASDSGFDSYRPETTFQYRVVFTSTYSKQASWQVIDEFTVTFRDACYNLNVGLTTGVSDFTYRVESGAAQVTKTPVFWED